MQAEIFEEVVLIRFLNKDNDVSPTTQENLPSDLESPPADQIEKTIVL